MQSDKEAVGDAATLAVALRQLVRDLVHIAEHLSVLAWSPDVEPLLHALTSDALWPEPPDRAVRWMNAKGEWVYPMMQFDRGEPDLNIVRLVGRFETAFRSRQLRPPTPLFAAWLVTPYLGPSHASPVQLLRHGDVQTVYEIAESWTAGLVEALAAAGTTGHPGAQTGPEEAPCS